jgi:hypothetical protein
MSTGKDVAIWMDDVERVPQGHLRGLGSREGYWNAPTPRDGIPYVTEVSPAVLITIAAGDVLSFRAVYPNGAMRGVIALKMAKVWELAFDGAQLGPGYRKQSTVESLTDGYRFNLRRDGGWPVSPVIFPLAYDIYGNENA